MKTFTVDCPYCSAIVAAKENGIAEEFFFDPEYMASPSALRIHVGKCPKCDHALAGTSDQLQFAGFDADEDIWSSIERVYPNPGRTLTSENIPKAAKVSLAEGEKCVQAGAPTAAVVMFGRALEAICRDKLNAKNDGSSPKHITLAKGLAELKASGFIDERLFKWSEQLRAFRNLGAHANDDTIDRQDAQDLKAFVYAIAEYIYDLADRYDEFIARSKAKKKKAAKPAS